MIASARLQHKESRGSSVPPLSPCFHITLETWPLPILIQEGRLANQPALLVEMAGIEPASEEFDDEHLQA